jgi:ATP synthase protein I
LKHGGTENTERNIMPRKISRKQLCPISPICPISPLSNFRARAREGARARVFLSCWEKRGVLKKSYIRASFSKTATVTATVTGEVMDDEERNRKRMQMIATYAMLPFIIGVPPIVGWYIGSWIDKHFDTKPYGMYILLALGVIAGAREFYRIIKQYKDDET